MTCQLPLELQGLADVFAASIIKYIMYPSAAMYSMHKTGT